MVRSESTRDRGWAPRFAYRCQSMDRLMAKIRVLIADDHAVLRAGLRLLLNSQPDCEVVGEAGDVQEALRKTRELRPDIVTLDLAMPGGGSVRMIDRLRRECPDTRVLV